MIKKESEHILSIAIRRNAGTTLERAWRELYNPENTWFYNPYKDGIYRSDKERVSEVRNPVFFAMRKALIRTSTGRRVFALVQRLVTEVETQDFEELRDGNWAVLHGLIDSASLPEWLREMSKFTTVIREPFERAKSHFRSITQLEAPLGKQPPWFEKGFTFKEFIHAEPMINFQKKTLTEDLDNFEIVGDGGELSGYWDQFDPEGRVTLRHLSATDITAEEWEYNRLKPVFRELNSEDYELYNEALRRARAPVGNPIC